jgi:hypothetical protein
VAEFNRIKTAELQEEKTRIAELERENAELRAVISTCHSVLFDVLMDGCEFEGDNPPDLVKAIKLCSETERAGRKKNPTSPRSVSSVNKEETI